MNTTAPTPPSGPLREPISTAKLLAWGGSGVLLYVGHAAFIPVALAGLFALILSAPVEALHDRRVPRGVSAALILMATLGSLAAALDAAWLPAQAWIAQAPDTVLTVKQKVSPIAEFISRLENLGRTPVKTHSNPRTPVAPPSPAANKDNAPLLIMNMFGTAAAGILTFLIVTLFLLSGGPLMLARLAGPFTDNLHASHVVHIIEQVRKEVGRFYLTTTLINLGLGIATTCAMWMWGLSTPLLWGTMAALLNYIPYAGPAITMLILTFVALMSFNSLTPVFGVAGTYLGIALIEGNVAQPLLVGRRMEVNPLLVFLALWFGGLFWGIAGIILATPTLVALKVIAKESLQAKTMLEFLSPLD